MKISSDETTTAAHPSRLARSQPQLSQRQSGRSGAESNQPTLTHHTTRRSAVADRVLWLEGGRFEIVAGMVSDPVCRMQVDPAGPYLEWEDRTVGFCSAGCQREGEATPSKFMEVAGAWGGGAGLSEPR